MRFARIHCDNEAAPAGLEELLARAELDFLQLDYQRPRQVKLTGKEAELPECATSFPDALKTLGKTIFLQPEFRVIASPGWDSSFICAEQAAGTLVEAGCGDVPMAAVRGSNLLPIIDMMQGQKVEFGHEETGAPLRELRAPLLAADLQIGAGPFAIAWDEGARVIVAGCYDCAAPVIGAAAATFGWSWNEADKLAAAATAARAAEWSDWEGGDGANGSFAAPWDVSTAVLDASGETTLHAARAHDEAAARLEAWLRAHGRTPGGTMHADVRWDATSARCRATGGNQIAIAGAKGAATDNRWRLELLYLAAYAVETMIEFSAEAPAVLRRQLAEIARSHLRPDDPGGVLTVRELHCGEGSGSPSWLHVHYQSQSRAACQQVADQLVRLTAIPRQFTRVASGPPAVTVQCGVWPTRVPRDAVDIAVETRLAKEWE